MPITKSLALLGYATGIAAADQGCEDGPRVLQKSSLLDALAKAGIDASWQVMLQPRSDVAVLPAVAELCTCLATETLQLTQQNKLFAVLGGDHSSAMGTWSGVAAAKQQQGAIGLIWVDAHLDSHTPESSESGNIHGMPVAHLLGYGAAELTGIINETAKIKPEHLCFIGIRSFEAGEEALIKCLGVRVYLMDEVKQRGVSAVLQEALQIVKRGTVGYGLSIDLDGIDPTEAPGVGSPEPDGILVADLYRALSVVVNDKDLLGIEIAEFNPHHDVQHRTEKVIQQLLLTILKG